MQRATAGFAAQGTKGATFVGPTPEAGEAVVFKTRYSGFYDTNLDQVLRELHADTLVVCGLTTECCVDCTVARRLSPGLPPLSPPTPAPPMKRHCTKGL